MRESAQHTLRIQKALEDANLKITGVISDLLGASCCRLRRSAGFR